MPDYISYVDDILAPEDEIKIEYWGPDPFKVYGKLSGWLQSIFQGRGLHIFEDEFRWDASGVDPITYYIKIRFNKGIDKWSTGDVVLKIFGTQPLDPTKNGKLLIKIGGTIETKYPFGTPLQKLLMRGFIWLYHDFIYNEQRRSYILRYKRGIEQLEAEIRSTLKLVMRERLT